MSCGKPHATDCSHVLDAVYRFLDGEVDDAGHHLISEHLDECGPCLRQYGIEREVKVLVARCCGDDRAPDSLRAKVITRIREIRVTVQQVEYRGE
jgi:mycothiol system anti-sigma-R factor